jgi:diadenosine tetraphosphatase ApaH/serine/threonine PP2A family protein phosphatase
MRALIIGDIHSNLEAFRAVLDDAVRHEGFDRVWCLGDVVGYGPDPVACIALLRRHDHLCVVGNHDRAAIGQLDTRDFNSHAAAACRWTTTHLRAEDVAYLSRLPETLTEGNVTLVHGSLRRPIWEYLLSEEAARATFELLDTACCFVGHTHVPCLYRLIGEEPRLESLREGEPFELGVERLIVNPGAVGQPRDGDPRAAYVIYDDASRTLLFRRVEYDVAATQEKMRRVGLPSRLTERLAVGV